MNILRKMRRLFGKERRMNSVAVSRETDENNRVKAEIILSAKESMEMDRKKRRDRFNKWLIEHQPDG
jgi:hypothetical protein